jgi:hypothetical protein
VSQKTAFRRAKAGVRCALSSNLCDVLGELALEKCQRIGTGDLDQAKVRQVGDDRCIHRRREFFRKIAKVLNFTVCYSRANAFELELPCISHKPNTNKSRDH